jgi:hypothetical protein
MNLQTLAYGGCLFLLAFVCAGAMSRGCNLRRIKSWLTLIGGSLAAVVAGMFCGFPLLGSIGGGLLVGWLLRPEKSRVIRP